MMKAMPARYILCLLGFFGFVNLYSLRFNLSVAIVAMVGNTQMNPIQMDGEMDETCSELLADATSTLSNVTQNVSRVIQGEFDWDPLTQSHVLGSFFYGYMITQVPGGVLAEKYSAKWVFGIGLLVTSVFTLLTPIAARWSVWALVVARVIEGLGEGVVFPAANVLIGRWAPTTERSRISTAFFNGAYVGSVLTMALSGVMCDSGFLGGWPSVFYVSGTVGCIWFALWSLLVYEYPENHPRISKEELLHIGRGRAKNAVQKPKTPWRALLTSVPVWALTVAQFGKIWGAYMIMIQLPTYMFNILHFNMKQNGLLSAAPILLSFIFAAFSSVAADKWRASGRHRNTTIRKVFNSIGFFGAAICLLIVAYSGCRPTLIVILITLSMGFLGCANVGYMVTHVDMSPEFAGTLFGITNLFSNVCGFLVPAFVGWMIQDKQTVHRWSLIFITSSAILTVTGLVYAVFCQAELQSWGRSSEPEESKTLEHGEQKVPLTDLNT